MGRNTLEGKRIWITGASSGIGRSVALEFAANGCSLILSGRSEEKLREVVEACGTECTWALPFDAGNRDENQKAVQEIKDRAGGIDIAFFNAGNCEYVDVEHFDAAVFERQMQLNYFGMVYGVEAALPLLRNSASPQIVGMSSASVYGGLPRAEAYGASKAAAKYFFESLRVDLLEEKIPVSVVCPGFVRTPLTDLNEFPMPCLIESEEAAKRIVKGVRRKVHEIHFPKRFTWTVKLIASLPAPIYSRLISRMTKGK